MATKAYYLAATVAMVTVDVTSRGEPEKDYTRMEKETHRRVCFAGEGEEGQWMTFEAWHDRHLIGLCSRNRVEIYTKKEKMIFRLEGKIKIKENVENVRRGYESRS
eukprot:GHVO01003339.1.p1 GENE.GHVO01003339.1~~GHVO01003339.1.p1  ORF type:complete len:106 (-),score=8.41 GHVO01003339.1:549-866(-)